MLMFLDIYTYWNMKEFNYFDLSSQVMDAQK